MFELKQRSLPFAALEKLSKLENLHQHMLQGKLKKTKRKTLHQSLQKHQDKTKKEMLRQVETSKYKKLILERLTCFFNRKTDER